MAKVTPITEHFQHFVGELKESFWGDLQGQVQQSMRRLFELLSERQRDLYMVSPRHSRQKPRQDYRNGYYERDFVTRFGTLRLRIARTRNRGFLPEVLEQFQRRAEEVSLLIREAFLRGISTRQVGRLVAILTGEALSPQTVSRLTRHLDAVVRAFHQAPLQDEWAYLFLDGVSLRVRRPAGGNGCTCWWPTAFAGTAPANCWPFCAARAKARRPGKGCWRISIAAVWSAKTFSSSSPTAAPAWPAIETVYPRVLHQRCWVHKMRNILEKVRRRTRRSKADAQAIYRAERRRQAAAAFRAFRRAGRSLIRPWCADWSEICLSC